MIKLNKLILTGIMLLAVLVTVSACSSNSTATTTPNTAEQEAVRAWADPATVTTLEGLSEGDLAKYTQNADPTFKAAVTQTILDKTTAQINSQYGSFKSITFVSTENQSPYIIVHYKAQFTKGELGVRMVFDQNHLVAGQWFE